MMQMRPKDGSDKRFYCPERDLVHAIPRMLKQALISLEGFPGNDIVTVEELGAAARDLGKLVGSVLRGEAGPMESYRSDLLKWHRVHGSASGMIIGVFFRVLMGEFHGWALDAKPKTKEDDPLNAYGLDELDLFYAKTDEEGEQNETSPR